jgi:pimeloyl-ACP methyl ester carboxylesterase
MTFPGLTHSRAALVTGCVVAAAASAAAFHVKATADPPSSVNLQPCDVPGIPSGGRCGTYEVYENRAIRTGRKIGLNIVVIPALNATSVPEAVFWLEGGPGGAGTQAIGPVSQNYLRGLRSDHDLVFVDERGTGKSAPLKCDDIGETPADLDRYFGKLFPAPLIRACRDKLEPIADLTQYTTSIAMDDLDDVRGALGYQQVDLAGASYGTLEALVYMRQHPDRVRSAFLVGMVTPDFRLPLPFARAAQHALELMFADCAAEAVCRTAFPNVKDEFNEVLARFDRGPLDVQMIDPVTQQRRTVALERESYVEHVRALLYSTAGARVVPLVVHQAFLNDFLPFQTMAVRYNLGGASTARGLYFSVTCSEAAPFISDAEIVAETQGTFLGDRRVRAHLAACADWPHGAVATSFTDPVRSDVPVVVYSGDADGSTPPWIGSAAVKSLSHGRQIMALHTGHQIDGPCTWDLMQAFVRNPVVQALDASCAAKAQRPPFVTELPK